MAKENRGRLHRRLAAALAVLALGMAAVPALPAAAEDGYWNDTDAGWRYITSTGKAVAGRLAFIDGKWYRFDSDGIMQTGWVPASQFGNLVLFHLQRRRRHQRLAEGRRQVVLFR